MPILILFNRPANVVLVAQDVTVSLTVENTSLVQHHVLTADDLTVALYTWLITRKPIAFKQRDVNLTFQPREREAYFVATTESSYLTDESGNYLTDESGNRFYVSADIQARPVIIKMKQRDTNIVLE